MGLSLVPYLVDISKLRATIGSESQDIISRIRDKDPETFEYRQDSDDLTLGEALTQLVMNGHGDKKSRDQYQFVNALEALCGELGTVLPFDLWCGTHWTATRDSNVYSVLLQTGPPIELTKPIEEMPMVGHLLRDRIKEMVEKMGEEGLTHKDKELQDLLKEFESWLRLAVEQETDLVLFYQ